MEYHMHLDASEFQHMWPSCSQYCLQRMVHVVELRFELQSQPNRSLSKVRSYGGTQGGPGTSTSCASLDPCPPRPSWPFGFVSTSILYYPRKGRSPQDRSIQTHHNFPVLAILSARTRKGTEFVKSKSTAVDQKGSLASLVLLLLECGGSPAHF
jgi:hypothetical protein